jgi:glutamate synthase (ferredoxin)
VRGSLAALGYTSMDEIIGRSDLLKQDVDLTKTNELDLSFLTTFMPEKSTSTQRRTQEAHSNGPCVDDELLANKDLVKAIEEEGTFAITLPINNVDRSTAARVSGQVAKR